ncbi:hypothetical protein GLOTRDRAFT_76907 [Gloeophyllum trabeum ATCC 11539]|uniref:GST N-terminal domain-containing protein n=1 Tax=Gloeophyllum trabeum (strain ATCC 11539 / FP-39264 / Madison 617) TaxID=670483 RepID=S7Q328_GLOTA|nr:uncharacterized protein GLOTRDRAFT_76907 [Gloeophyllum trabeum ATCC 11539]EPQ54411.1 hypothetical protein GLOTRDRAFT_76907 [Gloeophyllum trabeum ATCC 11539]
MTDEITLYDLASNRPNPRGWSSNTLKARFALQLKGIPFKTVWVEFPDIESVCKSLGAPPTSVWPDGQPMYTLPVIKDPGTNTVLADSWAIAKYLDATYTARPPLIPEGTDGLQAAFSDAATRIAMMPMSQAFLPLIPNLLNPSSIPYYRFRREQMLGLKLEDFCPLEKRPEVLDTAKKGFSVVAGWYAKSGKEYLMGEKPCFADLSLGAFLAGTKQIFGEQSDEWKLIKTWDDGRWARLLKSIESLSVAE